MPTSSAKPSTARPGSSSGDEPTFRVRGKNFVFANQEATALSVKLPKEEAIAVVASDPLVLVAPKTLAREVLARIEGAADD